MPDRTPAQRLLDALGPVSGFDGDEDLTDFGMPSGAYMEDTLERAVDGVWAEVAALANSLA